MILLLISFVIFSEFDKLTCSAHCTDKYAYPTIATFLDRQIITPSRWTTAASRMTDGTRGGGRFQGRSRKHFMIRMRWASKLGSDSSRPNETDTSRGSNETLDDLSR